LSEVPETMEAKHNVYDELFVADVSVTRCGTSHP